MNNHSNEITNKPQINKNVIIESIINFVYKELETWQNEYKKDPEYKVYCENVITQKLCLFLDRKSRMGDFSFMFLNQNQNLKDRHQVDISVYHYNDNSNYNYNDEPITVFECKRLPEAGKQYITGKTGGIQRFKLRVHGGNCKIAGMIGYIQKEDADYFYDKINIWIKELLKTDDGLEWSESECLQYERKKEKTYHTISRHKRISEPDITLHHLWIDIQ